MKVKFNFSVDVWIDNLEVEGDDYNECLENLYKMTLDELIENGIVRESDVREVDAEVLEQTFKVKATNIEYDIDEEDLIDDPELLEKLPSKLDLEVTCNKDNLEDEIADAITLETDYLINDFNYEIIEEK